MIFNEIYSAYYHTVAKIIASVLSGQADEATLNRIVCDNAFGESMLTVLPSLKSEKWQLIKADMTTPLRHIPSIPLTLTQKRWLKAISLDPRIRLFDIPFPELADVQPLFTAEDYYIYDQYHDGDPYGDETYIAHFQLILSAIRDHHPIALEMTTRKGNTVYAKCIPKKLEYSQKDDKFRLVTSGCRFLKTINLARITKCKRYYGFAVLRDNALAPCYQTVTLKVWNERNTLERCLLHFAHFEKSVERMEDHYLLHIKFDHSDEPEMVIRVLSFGPTVEVIASESFRNLIIDKLKKQKSCELR